jgi:hypothetical protein
MVPPPLPPPALPPPLLPLPPPPPRLRLGPRRSRARRRARSCRYRRCLGGAAVRPRPAGCGRCDRHWRRCARRLPPAATRPCGGWREASAGRASAGRARARKARRPRGAAASAARRARCAGRAAAPAGPQRVQAAICAPPGAPAAPRPPPPEALAAQITCPRKPWRGPCRQGAVQRRLNASGVALPGWRPSSGGAWRGRACRKLATRRERRSGAVR